MRTGRPPKSKEDRKDYSTRIRLTKAENDMLNECSEELGISKTEVLTTGLQCVYDDLPKDEKEGNG